MNKVFFSVDIETDGVVAGRNNMLSLGCAALDMNTGAIVSGFKRNLETIGDLHSDPDTMRWWKDFPEAFVKAREGAMGPKAVMEDFVDYIERNATPDSLLFAWNPVMDLGFVRYYVHRFHKNGPDLVTKGFFAKRSMGLDQKTCTAIATGMSYSGTKLSTVPSSLRLDEEGKVIKPHDHDALNDAIEQAHIFFNTVRRLGVEL